MLWFRASWYLVNQKNGVSALGLQRPLGLRSYRTAWTWLHKLRYAMVRAGRDKLSGLVEVDETYIGGKKPGKRGGGAEGKTLIAVAGEDKGEHLGRIRLCRIADASAGSLIPALQESVEPGSTVRTDGGKGYVQLSSQGYQHTVVRPSANVGDNLLPWQVKLPDCARNGSRVLIKELCNLPIWIITWMSSRFASTDGLPVCGGGFSIDCLSKQ